MSSKKRNERVVFVLGALAILIGAAAATFLAASSSSDSPPAKEAGASEGAPGSLDAAAESNPAAVVGAREGEGWEAWRTKRRRHELSLRELGERRDWAAVLEEAILLIELDPFHDQARSLRDRARLALGASAGEDEDEPFELDAGTARVPPSLELAQGELRRIAEAAIDARYPDAVVAAAIRLYAVDGRLDQAIEKLRSLPTPSSASRAGAGLDAAEREGITARLIQLEAGLQQVHSLLRQRRLSDADRQLHLAIEVDQGLAPWSELGSVLVRDTRRAVAKAWLEEGKHHLARSQTSIARAAWRRGIQADPSLLELQMVSRRLQAND